MSPGLWKKLSRGLSAGRVQSVAMHLIVERERERMMFKTSEYYGIEARLLAGDEEFSATAIELSSPSGTVSLATTKDFESNTGKLKEEAEKSGVLHLVGTSADGAVAELMSCDVDLCVQSVDSRRTRRRAPVPFITSTLQQEASGRLGISVGTTMRVAQSLYEKGFITYMRTDNPNLSDTAAQEARDCVGRRYGSTMIGSDKLDARAGRAPKNAQEAHEAIRPAGETFLEPQSTDLEGNELRLYRLVYSRTLASVMKAAEVDSTTILIEASIVDRRIAVLKANGSVIATKGFLISYEDHDLTVSSRDELLPSVTRGDKVDLQSCRPVNHCTQPPSRFSEASLVRSLESLGIGRPSTYAHIIETLAEREYVQRLPNKALGPSLTAFAVDNLLSRFCPSFVDSDFTASMEDYLDGIANGDADKNSYLKEYYCGTDGLLRKVEEIEVNVDPAEVKRVILPPLADLEDKIAVKVSPYGPYLEDIESGLKATIPSSIMPEEVNEELAEKLMNSAANPILGVDPESGLPVYLKVGRYGPYVQRGDEGQEQSDKETATPKRASLMRGMQASDVNLEVALELLSLPRLVAKHPKSGAEIRACMGRFGPYLTYDDTSVALPKDEDIMTLSDERAVDIVLTKEAEGKVSKSRKLGTYDGSPVLLKTGKFGLYISNGKRRIRLPGVHEFNEVTVEQAQEVLRLSVAKKQKKSS
eukprot:Plantae.Rhodophyta-Rhodochaete_pulchella.ctg9369.p1 GENE.Plantae.Rhodophyta-Rhodochaete_pulchella.ctg9369~~Plantae.Rhodophyta-Rhodochaete_pulchella.ctg9369.p1  ORF type:complete len:702 (+),score=115.86 Plantae.Rhodophyta-Rhodochaete_pulchella.ctg9369:3-2108(+)